MVIAMRPFWPTLLAILSLCGCRRYSLTGRWIGPLPIAGGDHCRIRLFPTQRFDFVCDGDLQAGGQGTWRQRDRTLELRFDWIHHRGQVLRDKPTDLSYDFDLRMNVLTLRPRVGEAVVWERRMDSQK